ncbi:MAG: hypothetical protein ACTSVY_16125 [Candidatus Helarchaeota archaeon]
MVNTSGHPFEEIPDNVRNKEYFLLGKQLFKCIKKLGWNYYENKINSAIMNSELIYDLLRERLNESILTAKAVMDGKIKKPWRILTYTLFPPIVAIRSDTQQGSMKLLFGSDVDSSYVIIPEISNDIFIVNCSLNDGLPIDWWLAGPDDDVLERKHLKLGIKLKNLPYKMKKGVKAAAFKMIDILKDVRNERDPSRASAMYHVGATFLSGALNTLYEWKSNFEAYGAFWDGLQSRDFYKMPETHFNFVPHPPILNALIRSGRRSFIKKWSSWAGNKLFINHIEPTILDWIKNETPEVFNIIFEEGVKEGIPFPIQSMVSGMDIKEHFKQTGTYFDESQINKNKIFIEDLNLTSEDAYNGIYLRIDRHSNVDEKIDQSFIISTGLGRNAKIYQE